MTTNGSVHRSWVSVNGDPFAVLPTWSDGAIVAEAAHRAGRADVTVQYGEWHGAIRGMAASDAPATTHTSYEAVVSLLKLTA